MMAKLVNKFLVATALVAIPLLSPPGNADTIHLDTLKARKLRESGGFDRIRIVYRVDGGREQAVSRHMRHGDVWNVALDITFTHEVTIRVFEDAKWKWFKGAKQLGAVTLYSGSIADDKAEAFDLTGHGARYWMSIGRGNYAVPEPPAADPKAVKPPPERWEDGGLYATPEAASAAGERLVTANVAKRFQVGIDFQLAALHALGWRLSYVPKE
jgi:hypothetical protein